MKYWPCRVCSYHINKCHHIKYLIGISPNIDTLLNIVVVSLSLKVHERNIPFIDFPETEKEQHWIMNRWNMPRKHSRFDIITPCVRIFTSHDPLTSFCGTRAMSDKNEFSYDLFDQIGKKVIFMFYTSRHHRYAFVDIKFNENVRKRTPRTFFIVHISSTVWLMWCDVMWCGPTIFSVDQTLIWTRQKPNRTNACIG